MGLRDTIERMRREREEQEMAETTLTSDVHMGNIMDNTYTVDWGHVTATDLTSEHVSLGTWTDTRFIQDNTIYADTDPENVYYGGRSLIQIIEDTVSKMVVKNKLVSIPIGDLVKLYKKYPEVMDEAIKKMKAAE
jgi:hypothetical protein